MSKSRLSFLFLTLSSFLLLNHPSNCFATQISKRQERLSQCQIHRLQALRPNRRIESEGGVTDMWLQNDDQLRCTGIAVIRRTIRSNSYILPGYTNSPKLTYIVQGQGIFSAISPGCPETYQSFQRYQEAAARTGADGVDEHQKVQRVRQGDVVATPTGMVDWFYNDGQEPLVIVFILDTSSSANQIDDQIRKFYIGGNQEEEQEQLVKQQQMEIGGPAGQRYFEANNVLSDLDDQILVDVLGVSRDVVERVKGRNVAKGHIITARGGLQMVKPTRMEEEEQEEEERSRRRSVTGNGLEETLCTVRLKEHIGSSSRADIYNPEAGYVSTVNSVDLPVLSLLQLSAKKGSLRPNAILAPHWNLNAHSVIYVIRGSARVQIVGSQFQTLAYDGQVREGEVLVVPQNFVVVKRAGNEGFDWVSFKTNENAMTQSLAGKTSPFRGLPLDLLASMYQISRQEAENLKYNRGREVAIFAPSYGSHGRASA